MTHSKTCADEPSECIAKSGERVQGRQRTTGDSAVMTFHLHVLHQVVYLILSSTIVYYNNQKYA